MAERFRFYAMTPVAVGINGAGRNSQHLFDEYGHWMNDE
jgi:hypothetical protein